MYTAEIKGIKLKINTSNEIFSPERPDKGTLAMLSEVEFSENDKVLDLGCGAGLVGITAAKVIGGENVVMCDVMSEAVKLSKENAELNGADGVKIYLSDGFSAFDEKNFTLILSNPPYHTDFSVAKHFIEKSFNRLTLGGRMYMVTKRKEWYKNKFISIFGGVKITEKDGYFIFSAEKKSKNYAGKRK